MVWRRYDPSWAPVALKCSGTMEGAKAAIRAIVQSVPERTPPTQLMPAALSFPLLFSDAPSITLAIQHPFVAKRSPNMPFHMLACWLRSSLPPHASREGRRRHEDSALLRQLHERHSVLGSAPLWRCRCGVVPPVGRSACSRASGRRQSVDVPLSLDGNGVATNLRFALQAVGAARCCPAST